METSPIIAELDPPRNIFLAALPGRIGGSVDELDLQRPVDRFRQSIVIAYPCPPDGSPYAELFQFFRELADV